VTKVVYLNDLVLVGRAIQQRLNLMLYSMLMIIPFLMLILLQNICLMEKLKYVLDFLSGQGKGRLLHLSEIDALHCKISGVYKHPKGCYIDRFCGAPL